MVLPGFTQKSIVNVFEILEVLDVVVIALGDPELNNMAAPVHCALLVFVAAVKAIHVAKIDRI
jgi:hypothetical protein